MARRHPSSDGRIARRFAERDALHFPLTVMVPRTDRPPAITRSSTSSTSFCPQFFSRAERTYRRIVYPRSARESRAGDHHLAARGCGDRRPPGSPRGEVRPIHLGLDHDVFRPGTEPRESTRSTPRAAGRTRTMRFCSTRSGSPPPSARRRARSHLIRRCGAGRRALARARGAWRRRRPLPAGGRARLPQPLRGLRPAAARGDGVRLPGRLLERRLAARGRRRRRTALRPELGRGARSTRSRTYSQTRTSWRRRGIERAAGFSWKETARRHEEVYAELAA